MLALGFRSIQPRPSLLTVKRRQHPHLRQTTTLFPAARLEQDGPEGGRRGTLPILDFFVHLPPARGRSSGVGLVGRVRRAESVAEHLGQEEDHPVCPGDVIVLLECFGVVVVLQARAERLLRDEGHVDVFAETEPRGCFA
jgi:hypothetical protein